MTNNITKKVLSWDAETNGLWGEAFSIGAVLYEDGIEVASFYARCPIQEPINPWVSENVLPQMESMEVTHSSYEEMLRSFAEFYLAHKDDAADVIFHMGIPVEARVVLDMHRLGFIGDWDGAYPWLDIAGCLKQAGFDCTSVDSYNANHGIVVPQPESGGTHNPLYDSRAAALCYMDLMTK